MFPKDDESLELGRNVKHEPRVVPEIADVALVAGVEEYWPLSLQPRRICTARKMYKNL